MTKDAILPNSICVECYKQVEICHTFRKMCVAAYQKLKLHLQAAKMKEANELNNEASTPTALSQKSVQIEAQDNSISFVNVPMETIKTEPGNIIETECEKKEKEEKRKKRNTFIVTEVEVEEQVELNSVTNENNVELPEDNQLNEKKVIEMVSSSADVIEVKDFTLQFLLESNTEFLLISQCIVIEMWFNNIYLIRFQLHDESLQPAVNYTELSQEADKKLETQHLALLQASQVDVTQIYFNVNI